MKYKFQIYGSNNECMLTSVFFDAQPLYVNALNVVVEANKSSFRIRHLNTDHVSVLALDTLEKIGNLFVLVTKVYEQDRKPVLDINSKWKTEQNSYESNFFKKSSSIITILACVTFSFHIFHSMQEPEIAETPLIPKKYVQVIVKSNKTQSTPSVAAKVSHAKISKAASQLVKGGFKKYLKSSSLLVGNKGIHGALNKSKITTSGLSNWKSEKTSVVGVNSVHVSKGLGRSLAAVGVQGQGGQFVSMNWSESTVEEGLTKDEVGKVIHAHMSEVRYCYESAMIHNPKLAGRILIDFTIIGTGNVHVATVKDTTAKDTRLEGCLISKLKGWKFPKPKGGVRVAVSYPFLFKSLGG